MTKIQLRNHYKALRSKLSFEQIENDSISIANQLLKLEIWNKLYYHIFLTIEEQKEIQTNSILNILAGKDKNTVISKSNFKDYSMSHFLLTDNTTLRKNEYHIPEPIDGIPILTQQIDVVFVPLLAFDNLGHRVGYGKGFYDRFLANCRPETLKIGLSFFDVDNHNIIHSEDDITLDYCVNPTQIYQF